MDEEMDYDVFIVMDAADYIRNHGAKQFLDQLNYLYPHRYDELVRAITKTEPKAFLLKPAGE